MNLFDFDIVFVDKPDGKPSKQMDKYQANHDRFALKFMSQRQRATFFGIGKEKMGVTKRARAASDRTYVTPTSWRQGK